MYQEADGGFPPQGEATDIGETTIALGVRDLGIPPVGGGYAGGQVGRDGELHLQAPEYGRTIHYKATYSRPLTGGGDEAGIAGLQEVLVSRGTGFCRSSGGG